MTRKRAQVQEQEQEQEPSQLDVLIARLNALEASNKALEEQLAAAKASKGKPKNEWVEAGKCVFPIKDQDRMRRLILKETCGDQTRFKLALQRAVPVSQLKDPKAIQAAKDGKMDSIQVSPRKDAPAEAGVWLFLGNQHVFGSPDELANIAKALKKL